MRVDYIRFAKRADRSHYILTHFEQYLRGRVLDVGCDQAVLRKELPNCQYTGVDVGGTPDIQLDLEKVTRLPFDDGAFDCVVCADVLEHLDNLHAMFGELLRVTRGHAILSLPNNWMAARVPMRRGSGNFLHYGLPLERPADRHKWFFNLEQARAFVHGQSAARGDFRVLEERVSEKPKAMPLRAMRRLRYPSLTRYLNRYSHTWWVVLEKTQADLDPTTPPGPEPLDKAS